MGKQLRPDQKSQSYLKMEENWRLIDDLCSGTDGMRKATTRRLPKRMKEPLSFYKTRLNSSFLYEAFKDVVDVIVAKPFAQEVTVRGKLPSQLEEFAKDVDGRGTTLTQFAKNVFRSGWKYGFSSVFVDFPHRPAVEEQEAARAAGAPVPDVTPENNLAVEEEAGVRPYFVHVPPQALLGHQHTTINGKPVLSLVRYSETVRVNVDDFTEKDQLRVRVLKLGSWDLYVQSAEAKTGGWEKGSGLMSMKDELPFVTFYVEKDTEFEAEPPLKGLAHLNECHWQSSSLQRNSLDIARVPILVRLGFRTATDENGQPVAGDTVVSSNVSMENNDVNAKVFYCEHSGAALAAGERDLDRLEAQMAKLGGQVFETADTATGDAVNDSKGESMVQHSVRNLEQALEGAYRLAAAWLKVELPKDFAIDVYDDFGVAPQRATDIQALREIWVARGLTHKTFLQEVQKRSLISKEVDIEAEVEAVAQQGDDLSSFSQNPDDLPPDPNDPENPDEPSDDVMPANDPAGLRRNRPQGPQA